MSDEILQKTIRIGLVALVFGLLGIVFMPFITPILMAALFAFALERLVSRLSWRPNARKLPTIFVLGAFLVIVASPLALVIYKAAVTAQKIREQGINKLQLYFSLESLLVRIDGLIRSILERMNVSTADLVSPSQIVSKAGGWVVGWVADLATRTPELVLDLFIFSAALYFFLTESKWIRRTVSSLRILSEREIMQLVQIIQRCSYTTLIVTASVGAIQAAIVSIGGLIFGFSEFLLVFIITFFASFVPVIGAAPIALLLALLSLVQKSIPGAIGLLVVALIAGTVDNVLKPFLVASSSEEAPGAVISLFVILGSVLIYGLPGLFLGPILLELALKIIPILFPRDEETKEKGSGT